MKILRIIARLNVGGPARHVLFLTRGLEDEEFQSWLIAGTVPDGEQEMSYLAQDIGVEPIYLPEMSRELSVKDVTSLAPTVLSCTTARAVRDLLRARGMVS